MVQGECRLQHRRVLSIMERICHYKKQTAQMSNLQGRTMQCPFDPNHVMPYDRFLNHLDKCKFPDKKSYSKCRFNSYHIIHKDKIEHHEKNRCEDRVKYQKEESDDDDWGVQPVQQLQPEKGEKSTVSTAVTSSSKMTSGGVQKRGQSGSGRGSQTHNDSKIIVQDFDDKNFYSTSRRKR